MNTEAGLEKLRATKVEELVAKKRADLGKLDPPDLFGTDAWDELVEQEIEEDVQRYEEELRERGRLAPPSTLTFRGSDGREAGSGVGAVWLMEPRSLSVLDSS